MHDHIHTHTHTHVHSHGVSGESVPREELLALLRYMTGHNVSHFHELMDLAEQVREEEPAVYEKLTAAAADYEKGNKLLAEALADFEKRMAEGQPESE